MPPSASTEALALELTSAELSQDTTPVTARSKTHGVICTAISQVEAPRQRDKWLERVLDATRLEDAIGG